MHEIQGQNEAVRENKTGRMGERVVNMSNEEAITRLTEIGKRIEPNGSDYIALEMAITALWAQERQGDDGK